MDVDLGVEADTQALQLDPLQQVQETRIDLDAYGKQYTGRGKIERLHFIARNCPSLRVDAYRAAIAELRKTLDGRWLREAVREYKEHCDKNGLPCDNVPSAAEIDQILHNAVQRREQLENEVKNNRTGMVKELIRVSHMELGEHLFRCGDLDAAIKNFSKSREAATTQAHHTLAYLNILKCGLDCHRWKTVEIYANKLQPTDSGSEGAIGAYMRCAQGLVHLMSQDYRVAANIFLSMPFNESDAIRDIMAVRDIAVYGGLCGLASFDRQMLKKRFLEQPNFKPFLETVPEIRETIRAFYDSNYKRCLQLLAGMKNDLLLDIYMSGHVQILFDRIRQNCIVQYFSPFMSADMSSMAAVLNTSVQELEKEVIQLIASNRLQARIDSEKQVLLARSVNERAAAFAKTLELSEQYAMHVRGTLFRVAMLRKNLQVRNAQPS